MDCKYSFISEEEVNHKNCKLPLYTWLTFSYPSFADYRRKKYLWLKQKSPAIFNEVLKPNLRLNAWRRLLRKTQRQPKLVRSRRKPRSVSTERHVETMVVVDKKVTDYYRQHHDVRHPDGLTAYVLTIMNIVSSYSRLPAHRVRTDSPWLLLHSVLG